MILIVQKRFLINLPQVFSNHISLIGNISLQSIKAIGRSDVVLKLEFIKKPVYLILLIAGVLISPLAIAMTMVIYSIYSSIANARPLSRLVEYSYKEQFQDIWQSFIMTIIMCLLIFGFKLIIHNDFGLLVIQVIVGVIIYLGLSVFFRNKAFLYVKSVIFRRGK